MILAPFLCLVIHVHDGDGPLWCDNGIKVRIAGVQAPDFENAPPCRAHRPGYVCNDVLAAKAREITKRIVFRRTLTCRPVDRSHKRVVAVCTLPDGHDLRCAVEASGAAVEWRRYVVRYRLGRCAR